MQSATALEGVTELSDEDVDRYHEQGYIAINDVFSADEIAELQAVTDEFVEKSRALSKSDNVFDLEPSHSATDPKLRRLKHVERVHSAYLLLGAEPCNRRTWWIDIPPARNCSAVAFLAREELVVMTRDSISR